MVDSGFAGRIRGAATVQIVLIAAGAAIALAGAWFLVANLSGSEGGNAGRLARQSAALLSETVESIQADLKRPEVVEQARAVLDGETQALDAVRRLLRSGGISNILDVRVFPPGIEEIETGAYPEPDFGVLDMLMEARRQGAAQAEIHYPGTANENLAFAQSFGADDAEAVDGYLFLRVPVSVVTRRIEDPGADGWIVLLQGDAAISGRAPESDAAAGRPPGGGRQ